MPTDLVMVPIMVNLMLIFLFIFLGAAMFSLFEGKVIKFRFVVFYNDIVNNENKVMFHSSKEYHIIQIGMLI